MTDTDNDKTTPVGIPPVQADTTRQGKAAAPAAPATQSSEAPPPAKGEEPEGPPLEAELVGKPLAHVEFAQGQSDGAILGPVLSAIAKTAGVELADLHDTKKTPASLRAKIEDVTSAFFRLAVKWRGKGGSSLLVLGKNKDGKIVGGCEHEKGARSSVLVLDVPAASKEVPEAPTAKSGATGATEASLAPPAIGVTPPTLAPRRSAFRR